jgi:NAD-dependent SIR2 family protein deacetylase
MLMVFSLHVPAFKHSADVQRSSEAKLMVVVATALVVKGARVVVVKAPQMVLKSGQQSPRVTQLASH